MGGLISHTHVTPVQTDVAANGSMMDESTKPLNDEKQPSEKLSEDGQPNIRPDMVPRLYKRRWVMVFLFATYSMTNAYQWIHLNIIGDKIVFYYNVSLGESNYMKEVALDWLSMIYMLAYIPLIFPVTWLLDRRGLRLIGILGTLLNALGAWIKCIAVHPDRFPVLMFGQTICAIAQVFILGMPAPLAATWFGPNEVSTATSIGVFGNQIGCALGFLIPPEIVTNSDDMEFLGKRLSYMMYGGAAITTALFAIVLFLFKRAPAVPPSKAQMSVVEHHHHEDYIGSLAQLIRNWGFLLLVITYGLNTGSYYAIGTLLNPIVLHYYPTDHLNAGRIGLVLVVSGVAGSILAGLWLDKTKWYKATTVFTYVMSLVGAIVFTATINLHSIGVVFFCGGLLGFFMTGYLPVGFEFAAEITYPKPEGTSSGLLNASAQLFGIILTLGIRALIVQVENKGVLAGNITICAVLFVGAIGTALIKSDLKRQQAQLEKTQYSIVKVINSDQPIKVDEPDAKDAIV